MNKKTIFILCVCVVGILLIIIYPKNVADVSNSVVNPDNGDIAISYINDSGKIDVLQIDVFNCEGEKLFSKTFFSDGSSYADMIFDRDCLCICVGRTDEYYYILDRYGNLVDAVIPFSKLDDAVAFEGWKRTFGKMEYSLDKYQYCYEYPTIFRHKAKMTIKSEETVVVVYESL